MFIELGLQFMRVNVDFPDAREKIKKAIEI